MSKKQLIATLVLLVLFIACGIWAFFYEAPEEATINFGILSLVPPIAAILLCVITKEVIPALFVGSWIAGTMLTGWNPVLGFGKAVEGLWDALSDPWNARIVLTCIAMSGLVGVMQAGGGIKAVVDNLTKRIRSSRSASLYTEAAGFVIFFEDYVNTAVVGTTMKPLTDKFRVSKEKLSYIVDTTAAPIACIAIISSWVAFMLGQIGDQFTKLGIEGNAYITYIQSIPFVFYNIIALILLTFVLWSNRDFGPMYKAEMRARKEGKLIRDGATPLSAQAPDPDLQPQQDTPLRLRNFIVPIATLVIAILAMLMITAGFPHKRGFMEALMSDEMESSKALVYGSFFATFVTIAFYRIQNVAPLTRLFRGFLKGAQAIFVGTMILIFAWGISGAIKSVGTAGYVVEITRGILSLSWIPLIVFIIGMFISFCTGTSYGTMGVLMPIVVPLVFTIAAETGAEFYPYLLPTVGAVFAGAVWGDHCSPISDTTIMSSMFSGSDHMDHVATQMPYAMVAAVGAAIAYIAIGFGINHWLALLIGTVITVLIFAIISKPVPNYTGEPIPLPSQTEPTE